MRIVNVTRKSNLATEAETASTFWLRLVGLLGRRSLPAGHALVIEPCRSVHTAFMRYAIDVIYIDRAWKVTKVVRNLKPFRASLASGEAHAAIELPAGTVEQSGTMVGDELVHDSG